MAPQEVDAMTVPDSSALQGAPHDHRNNIYHDNGIGNGHGNNHQEATHDEPTLKLKGFCSNLSYFPSSLSSSSSPSLLILLLFLLLAFFQEKGETGPNLLMSMNL